MAAAIWAIAWAPSNATACGTEVHLLASPYAAELTTRNTRAASEVSDSMSSLTSATRKALELVMIQLSFLEPVAQSR